MMISNFPSNSKFLLFAGFSLVCTYPEHELLLQSSGSQEGEDTILPLKHLAMSQDILGRRSWGQNVLRRPVGGNQGRPAMDRGPYEKDGPDQHCQCCGREVLLWSNKLGKPNDLSYSGNYGAHSLKYLPPFIFLDRQLTGFNAWEGSRSQRGLFTAPSFPLSLSRIPTS